MSISHSFPDDYLDLRQAITYLNDAATSWPKAPGVVEAIIDATQTMPSHSSRTTPGEAGEDGDRCLHGPTVGNARCLLALLLRVDLPSQVAFSASVTCALNQAIWGLGLTLPRGARIITSVAEHNAVLRPLRHLQKLVPVHITTIGLDAAGHFDILAFERALAQGADFVALTHASNVTGHVYDVAPLFAKSHAAGAVTLLDASQSIGHIPVRPDDLHADIVAFPAHKGLRGPLGTAGLYVRPGLDLEPLIVGGTGGQSDVYYQPEQMPTRLEAGTLNVPAIAGMVAALEWHAREGDVFRAREQQLAAYLRAGLRAIPGVTLFDDYPDAHYLPVVSFRIDGRSVEESGQILGEQFNITCRTGLHCAPLIHADLGSAPDGTVRFSVSGFTTEEEIEHALSAVHQLARVGVCC